MTQTYRGLEAEELMVRVEVQTRKGANGETIPRKIRWAHGETLTIDQVIQTLPQKSEEGVQITKYTLSVLGRAAYLYHEVSGKEADGRWFWGVY